ncbi:hypothetical protein FHW36_11855 [Chitinophaga polysaccharea]|uniref:Uncharacterized protein n=1 Tax=Chitinophaga polysaccharea TaxID=1293035 RepID=A0A561P0V7_9BACT|nr:hypothetical protein [Chitinophaga polysaccharea]TWF31761.1 hypothetical protein FHW36_11855 [Chitinophaga polysaccharea]
MSKTIKTQKTQDEALLKTLLAGSLKADPPPVQKVVIVEPVAQNKKKEEPYIFAVSPAKVAVKSTTGVTEPAEQAEERQMNPPVPKQLKKDLTVWCAKNERSMRSAVIQAIDELLVKPIDPSMFIGFTKDANVEVENLTFWISAEFKMAIGNYSNRAQTTKKNVVIKAVADFLKNKKVLDE